MKGKAVLWAVTLVMVFSCVAMAQEKEQGPWRVVLQGLRPAVLDVTYFKSENKTKRSVEDALSYQPFGPLAVTPDGRFAVGREASAPHVANIVHTLTGTTVLSVALPAAVDTVAITDNGRTAALSTRQGGRGLKAAVYIVNVADGNVQLLIDGAQGVITFDKSGQHLAVMGYLSPDEKKGRTVPYREGLVDLGVYDIAGRKWLARTSTFAQIPLCVDFEGVVVTGYGLGGSPETVDRRIFPCHTRLDTSTGESSTERGVLIQGRGDIGPGKGDPDYKAPAFAERLVTARSSAQKKLYEIEPKSPLVESGFAALETDRGVEFVARGLVGEKSRRIEAVFTVGESVSGVQVKTLENLGDPHYSAGSGGFEPLGRRLIRVVEDRLVIRSIDKMGRELRETVMLERSYSLGPRWIMVAEEGGFAFYDYSGSRLGRVTLPSATYEKVFSGDYSTAALSRETSEDNVCLVEIICTPEPRKETIYGPAGQRAGIIRAPSAHRISTIQIENCQYGHASATALDGTGAKLAVYFNDAGGRRLLQLYDTETAALGWEVALKSPYVGGIADAGAGRWFVWTPEGLRVVTADGQLGEPIPGTAGWQKGRVRRLSRQGAEWVLLSEDLNENAPGSELNRTEAIVDLASNRVVARWHSSGASEVILEGAVLVRSGSHLSDVDFVDLETMNVLFTLQPVPVGEKFSWVVTTPDGCWDAGEGAEKYVAVFDRGTLVDEAGKNSRRRQGIVLGALQPFQERADKARAAYPAQPSGAFRGRGGRGMGTAPANGDTVTRGGRGGRRDPAGTDK